MVSVAVAFVVELVLSVAVTVTCTLFAVRYEGGEYCPLVLMEPAPELASPPETDHVTLAAPPLFSVAVNCSTVAPADVVILHPVQLVSMEAVPGEMENSLLEEPVDAEPPQPARMKRVGKNAIARIRAGHCRI